MSMLPHHYQELETIYAATLAGGMRTLAISAANPGEGVTTLAVALAERNLLAGRSTLLVDLNLHHPALEDLLSLEEADIRPLPLPAPQLVRTAEEPVALTGITAPSHREMVMKLRQPGILKQCIEVLKQRYDTLIFDTSALSRRNANNIPAEQVAAACDGSLLVVLAGQTTETMVSSAVEKLKTGGAQLNGCVLNDRNCPTLKSELLREIARIKPRFNAIANWLGRRVHDNRLLSLEI